MVVFSLASCAGAQVTQTGDLKKWHTVTLTFDGPSASETGTPNPFTNYRVNMTFSQGSNSLLMPGFFAADGNAANTWNLGEEINRSGGSSDPTSARIISYCDVVKHQLQVIQIM
jgi:hypothetical protein